MRLELAAAPKTYYRLVCSVCAFLHVRHKLLTYSFEANIFFTPEKPSIHKGVGSVRVLIEEQFFVTHLSIEGTRIAHFGKFWWVYADICIKCVS